MRGKKLIHYLYRFFKYLYWLNLVLGAGVFGFQLLNLIFPEKTLMTRYLGKFVLELKVNGSFQTLNHKQLGVHIEQFGGFPDLALNLPSHAIFVLLFTVSAVLVTLFYNYQLYRLFELLHNAVKSGLPFDKGISIVLKRIAKGSVLIFALASLLSLLKLVFIKPIVFENFVALPVFDNQVLNFLWIALAAFILSEVFKAGKTLQEEQELTI
jgi:hypothetical protein